MPDALEATAPKADDRLLGGEDNGSEEERERLMGAVSDARLRLQGDDESDDRHDGDEQVTRPLNSEAQSSSGDSAIEPRRWTVLLSVIAVSFGCYIHGTTVSFPAVFIPLITAANGTGINKTTDFFSGRLPFYVYQEEFNLVVSISAFGMLFGSLVAGPVANYIGRKWTLLLGTGVTFCVSYAILPFIQAMWMILVSRLLMGVGLGFSVTISTLYIMEICTPSMRGQMAVIPAIAGTLGVLTCQCLGAVLNWQVMCIVLTALHIPFFIMLIFIPETPVYLLGKEKIESAHKVLRMLRGKEWDVTKELTDLKVASEGSEATKRRVTFRDFITPSTLKPFLICLTLMFFFQFSGINIILQYTVKIFELAESTINEFLCNILVGLALLVSNVFTLMVAAKMPRRIMLLLSSLGISLCLSIMGVYFFLKSLEKLACEEGLAAEPVAEKLLKAVAEGSTSVNGLLGGGFEKDVGEMEVGLSMQVKDCQSVYEPIHTVNLGWLPLLVTMAYIFFFNLGYGSMIWITVAEILPLNVRSVTNSLSVGFTCLCSFLVSHTFTPMINAIKPEGVFWTYAAISFLGFVFIMCFVPETKDKSESEIAEFFLPKAERIQRSERRKAEQQQQLQQNAAA